MSENKPIKDQILEISDKINSMERQAVALLKGKRVKIISDYNGNPFYGSGPSLKGNEFEIKAVRISGYQCQIWDGVYDHCFMNIDEVDFI